MRRLLLLACFLAVFYGSFAVSPVTYAFDVFGNACSSGGGTTSAVCVEKAKAGNPLVGAHGTLITVANLIATIAGVMALFYLLYAGWMYITSGGDTTKVQNAKSGVLYAVIGLVIIAMADVIVGYVISKL